MFILLTKPYFQNGFLELFFPIFNTILVKIINVKFGEKKSISAFIYVIILKVFILVE